jgi:hypothetical protein
MARRKRELLDILRTSTSSDGPGAASTPDQAQSAEGTPKPPVSASVPSQPKPSTTAAKSSQGQARPNTQGQTRPSRRPSEPRSSHSLNRPNLKVPVGVVGLLVLVLLTLKFWPTGPADAAETSDPNGSTAVVETEPYSVLVATYKFKPEIKAIAIETARALRNLIPEHAVELTEFPAEAPENIELWIGASERKEELNALLRQVQESSVPTDKKNPQPFASARIERRKPLTSN